MKKIDNAWVVAFISLFIFEILFGNKLSEKAHDIIMYFYGIFTLYGLIRGIYKFFKNEKW